MTLTTLKVIALVSMLLDHMRSILPLQSMLMNLGMSMGSSYIIMEILGPLGRIAFPIFAFCIAQGCMHTGNQKRYLLRLLVGALVSEVPYQLAFYAGHVAFGTHNVFFTLLVGAAACMAYERLSQKKKRWLGVLIIAAAAVLAELMRMDYGGLGVLLIAAPYVFRGKYQGLLAMAVVVTVLYLGYAAGWSVQRAFTRGVMVAWAGALAALVLIGFYTGRLGKKMKWLFYVFYPAHIALLYAARLLYTGSAQLLSQ